MAVTDVARAPEFFLSVIGIASAAKDADGRPCGEAQAPAAAREGVELVLHVIAYPGSRRGKWINVSALRQMTGHWSAILGDLSALRAGFLARYRWPGFTIGGLWRFAVIASSLPAYLVRRREARGVGEAIPPDVASLFKAIQGVFMTTQHMIATGRPVDDVVAVDEFLAHTDAHGILLAPDGDRACSAPQAMLKEFMTVVIDGPAAGHEAARRIEDLVDDPDAFFQYGELAVCMLLAAQQLKAQTRLVAEALCREVAADGPTRALHAGLRALADELTKRQDGLPLEHTRRLVVQIAELLQEALGACATTDDARSRFLRLEPWGRADDADAMTGWLRPHGISISAGAAACLVDALALERDALGYFSRIQARVHDVLGLPAPNALDGDDLATAFPTVTHVIANQLALAIAHGRACTLTRGDSVLTLRDDV